MSAPNSYPFYLKYKSLPQPDIQKGTIEVSDNGIKITSEVGNTVLDKKYAELTKIKYTLTRFGIFMVIRTRDQKFTFHLNTVDDIRAIKADIASRPPASQLQQTDNIKSAHTLFAIILIYCVIVLAIGIIAMLIAVLRPKP